ncbi:hypothetical protein ScPMuIL_002591 [Solemya velum]
MPPKKKKGKGKGKKKGKKKDDASLELEDKYKKTVDEIQALKDHLSVRKEIVRRGQAISNDWRQKVEAAQQELLEQKVDQKSINSDMTRQYKTMQTEMGLRIHQLETELGKTRQQLVHTEEQLKQTRQEKEQMMKDKDEEIENLKRTITNMEVDYGKILDESLDNLISKIDMAKERWEEQATLVHSKNKQVLLEFGLNPLDI